MKNKCKGWGEMESHCDSPRQEGDKLYCQSCRTDNDTALQEFYAIMNGEEIKPTFTYDDLLKRTGLQDEEGNNFNPFEGLMPDDQW